MPAPFNCILDDRQALRMLEGKGMKKVILIALLATAPVSRGFAGSREELMVRMGFSKEEIAKDGAAHNGAAAGKSDPKEAAMILRDANEVNRLRELRAIQYQAESVAAAAEKSAVLAKAKEKDAEEKAEGARRATRRMLLGGANNWMYATALDDRDRLERNAQEARDASYEETRKAEQARAAANAIIAKARAEEAMLEKKRLARIAN
jgi:hypothetical protein